MAKDLCLQEEMGIEVEFRFRCNVMLIDPIKYASPCDNSYYAIIIKQYFMHKLRSIE